MPPTPDRATAAEVRAALAAVAVWPPDLDPDGRYEPLAGLSREGGAGEGAERYAAAISRRLGDAPLRLGRSTLLTGVASRLWSVTVVPAATHGVLPDLRRLLIREEHGAVVLGLDLERAGPAGWRGPNPDDVRRAVLAVLTPLVDALALSDRLLWGDAAASLHAVPRVHGLPAAAPWVKALLSQPPLAGELDERPDGTARRRTCCLFYLVPGAGLCGDCVLDHAPRRRSPVDARPDEGLRSGPRRPRGSW